MAHVARKFERFLKIYRRPDGGEWTGVEIAKASGGAVHRSYVTNLRKGRIENPGYEKLAAIARVMGFPPEAWFEEGLLRGKPGGPADAARGLAQRIDLLFVAGVNPKTGEPFTNADISRMSLGALSEEDVAGMRDGSYSNPALDQIVALAEAFGVHASYLVDRGREAPLLDGGTLDALRDATVMDIARESARLSARERKIVLGIARQFGGLRKGDTPRMSPGGG